MKIPFQEPPNLEIHIMAMETEWLDDVEDDGMWMLGARVENGDFNKERKNKIRLKILKKSSTNEALAHGGVVVFANIKKQALKKAVMHGLQYMMQTGALSREDIIDAAPKEE